MASSLLEGGSMLSGCFDKLFAECFGTGCGVCICESDIQQMNRFFVESYWNASDHMASSRFAFILIEGASMLSRQKSDSVRWNW